MEKNSYKNSYDFFALDYHNKRIYHWRELEIFLEELYGKNINFSGYNLDLGCANGRNFKLFQKSNSKLIGIDNSKELLRLARQRLKSQNHETNLNLKSVNLVLSDISSLPLRPLSIKNIFSIATIHHIRNKVERENLLSQLHRITKNNGFLVLTVWRRYQKKYRYFFVIDKIRRIILPKYNKTQKDLGLFQYGDKFIPWTLSNKKRTYDRFYHFFSKKEIKDLLKAYSTIIISKRGGPNKKDNFFVLTQKVDKNIN